LGSQFEDPEALEAVRRAANEHFQSRVSVALTLDAPESALTATLAQIALEEERVAAQKMRAEVEAHPLVRFAMQELGAELREVRLPKSHA
jgi:hypothetical protein